MHTNWDDLRFILSVAKHGSVAGGARALAVNHSTVLRRISAYERSRDVQIFIRRASGYQLTDAGQELIRVLQSVDGQFAELERKLAGHDLRVQGRVRVTTTDSIALAVMSHQMAALASTYSLIEPELAVSNGHLDFGRRDADVAVRPCIEPPPELVGDVVCPLGFRLCASPEYLSEYAGRQLESHAWLAFVPPTGETPPSRWLANNVSVARVVFRADSFVSLAGAVAAGMGVALLPVCMAHVQSNMQPLDAPPVDLGVNVWVLVHRDMKRAATVRDCADFLAQGLVADRAVLAGSDGPS